METSALVLGLAGIVLPIAAAFVVYRLQNPRRQLRWSLHSESLTPKGHPGIEDRLSLSVDGAVITDPHIVLLNIWSTGKLDIRSDAFDQRKPLTFNFDLARVGEHYETNVEGVDDDALVMSGNQVQLHPTLLRRGFSATVRLFTAGSPSVSATNPIADVELVEVPVSPVPTWVRLRRWTTRLIALSAGLVLASVVLLVSGLVTQGENFKTTSDM